MHIDLARAAENDAVLVDDVDRTVCLHRAEDAARRRARADAIQDDPVIAAISLCARVLVEVERGVLADVERIPGGNRLLCLLLDADERPAALDRLGGESGVLPRA